MICGACGQAIGAHEELAIEAGTRRILFRGDALDLSRGRAAILEKLMQHGRLPFHRLHPEPGVLRTQIHYMRRTLPADVRIDPIVGWGYELKVLPAGG